MMAQSHRPSPTARTATPTGPIGRIPGPLHLVERVAQGDSEDPAFSMATAQVARELPWCTGGPNC